MEELIKYCLVLKGFVNTCQIDFMFQSRWGYVDNDDNGVPEDSVITTLFIVPKIVNETSPNDLIFTWAFRFDLPETAYDVNIVGIV